MRARLLVLALALATAPASSYEYRTVAGKPVRWPDARATLHHDPVTFESETLVGHLLAAMATWSNVPGSRSPDELSPAACVIWAARRPRGRSGRTTT